VPHTPKDLGNLQNVQIESLFSANTLLLWPVDQGTIRAVNRIYPGVLFLRLLQKLKLNEDFYRLSMHDAVTMLSTVWSSVTQETIADCSVKVGFCAYAVASGQDYDDDDNDNNSVGDRQSFDI
jgi:hypothetical protein